MAKKIIENSKQDDDLKLLEDVNNEFSVNNQFSENTPDISIKGRGMAIKYIRCYEIYLKN